MYISVTPVFTELGNLLGKFGAIWTARWQSKIFIRLLMPKFFTYFCQCYKSSSSLRDEGKVLILPVRYTL